MAEEKKSSGAGKFFLGAALGAIAGAIAGKFISAKADENDGDEEEGCKCGEECSCNKAEKKEPAKKAKKEESKK